MHKKLVEDNQFVVLMGAKDAVQGSQRMVAMGQGVRAKVSKDKEGKTIVEAFYFDRDRYSEEKVEKWLEKHKNRIFESLHYVQMQSPRGSFEDTAMRLQRAINDSAIFPASARIEFVFPDRFIVCINDSGEMWEISYEDTGVGMVLGVPQKVELVIVKEKISEYIQRQNRFSEPNITIDGEQILFRLYEKKFNLEKFREKREVVVVLIESGTNFSKRRHYPKKVLQEAAPLFAGLKMYLDHPTDREEQEKPERSIREWLSTIVESWYEDGMVLGRVHIHNKWLLEHMEDETFRSEIGASINASGRSHIGEIDGQQMQIMEAILEVKSVDWVTEAGARGRVLQLIESQKLERQKQEIKVMKTVRELKESNMELFKLVEAEVRESMKGETEQKIKEAVEKAVKEALEKRENEIKEAAEKAKKSEVRKTKVNETVAGSKLPEKHRARFVENFLRENSAIEDEKLEAKLKEAILGEIKHLNDLGLGIKIDIDGANQGVGAGVVEEATQGILESAGLAEKKEDEKK